MTSYQNSNSKILEQQRKNNLDYLLLKWMNSLSFQMKKLLSRIFKLLFQTSSKANKNNF